MSNLWRRYTMKKQAVKSVAGFAVVLMVLSIIPSGAIASENATYADQINSANGKGLEK